jgi:hypothetical protein
MAQPDQSHFTKGYSLQKRQVVSFEEIQDMQVITRCISGIRGTQVCDEQQFKKEQQHGQRLI